MSAIVILFLCGLILLAFEVFIPGLVLGIFGGGCMAAGTIVAFAKYGSTSGYLTGFTGVFLVAATFGLEFWLMPKKGTMKRLNIGTTHSGAEPPPAAKPEDVLGKTCVAVTTLAPSGYVQLGDRKYEARSEGGFVQAGSALTVVGVNSLQLLVNPTPVSTL